MSFGISAAGNDVEAIPGVGSSGATAPSGINHNSGSYATQSTSGDLEPLNYETGDQKARNFGLALNIRDTDTNFDREITDEETRVRDMDRAMRETLLTQDQCDRLDACIVELNDKLCGVAFDRREELLEMSDKIFDKACELEDRLLENVQCQIQDAKCEFHRQMNLRWSVVSRAVGSSRNTFVIQQQDTALAELTRKLAALNEQLVSKALVQSHDARVQAFSVAAVARIDNYNASYGNMIGLWQIMRGAKRDMADAVDETDTINRTSVEDSFQDVTTFDWAGKYSERVSQANAVAGTFDGDYNDAGLFQALIGIISP